jgi:hypothetical protein
LKQRNRMRERIQKLREEIAARVAAKQAETPAK